MTRRADSIQIIQNTQTQAQITQEESRLSASLREAGQELVDRAAALNRAVGEAMSRLLPALEDVLAIDSGDDEDIDSAPKIERVERAVNIVHKVASISKAAAETAEKVIKLERQVRGEPTDQIAISTSLPTPQTTDQLRSALASELAALNRDAERSRDDDDEPN